MRKLLWSAAVVSAAVATALFLAARYGSRHPNSLVGQGASIASHIGSHYLLHRTDAAEVAALDDSYGAGDEDLVAPEEPEPAAELESVTAPGSNPSPQLALQDKLVLPGPALATTTPQESGAAALSPWPERPEKPSAASSSQLVFLPPLDESTEERYRLMPPCEEDTDELPATMPYATEPEYRPADSKAPGIGLDSSDAPTRPGGSEEQEMTAPSRLSKQVDIQHFIETRAREIYTPAFREGTTRFRPSIDTLDFRPCDARPEEFDPVEF
jgi:hypothetical protein